MGLLEDIVAELKGGKPQRSQGDPPVIRLSHALLMRMEPERATHLRVISGPQPRMDFRVDGVWGHGPDVGGSRATTKSKVCAQVIERLAEMTRTRTRMPFSFGSMHIVLDPPEPRPTRTAEFSSFHAQIDGGAALMIHAVHGADMPWSEAEIANRDAIGDAAHTAHEQRSSGRAKEAITTLERALGLCANQRTVSPMYRGEILDGLAHSREELGELDAAVALWLRAIEIWDAACAKENVTSAFARTELARLELDRNDVKAAQAHLAEARRIFEELFGLPCVYLHVSLQLARVERILGEPGARASLEDVRARAARQKDTVMEGCAAYELGLLASDHGDLPRAAACMRDALVKLDAPQPFTAQIQIALSRVLRAQGRDPEALSLVQHANEIMARYRAPEHPERVDAEIELARFEKPGRPYR